MQDPVAGLLDTLADRVAERVLAALAHGQHPDLIDQGGSPLGRHRHIAAVRRRLATGAAGASQLGRRYLLTREALDEELSSTRRGVDEPERDIVPEAPADLLRELGLHVVLGGRQ